MDKKKLLTIGFVLVGGVVAFKVYNYFKMQRVFKESIDEITTDNPEVTEEF